MRTVLHMWKHVIPECKDTGAMVFSIKLFSGYWTLCQHGLLKQSLRTKCLRLPEVGQSVLGQFCWGCTSWKQIKKGLELPGILNLVPGPMQLCRKWQDWTCSVKKKCWAVFKAVVCVEVHSLYVFVLVLSKYPRFAKTFFTYLRYLQKQRYPRLVPWQSRKRRDSNANTLSPRTNVVLGAFLTILIFLIPYPLTALQSAEEAGIQRHSSYSNLSLVVL